MLKSFSYNNASISYRLEGTGAPVVLLHGFGEDSHIWDIQVNFLKDHCQLIIPDLPGSGQSTILHDSTTHASGPTPHETTIDDYAAVIYALLQHENMPQVTMLGHSMGGYIMLAFAEKYPAAIMAMGLVNSTAFADSEEKKQVRARAIETIEKYGAEAFLKTTIPTLFAPAFREKFPGKVAALIQAGSGFRAEALQQYYRAMMNRPDRTAVLKSNPVPVLFVMGTEDAPAPVKDVVQQTHLPDKSYIHVLQGVGHMSMWEAPDALNQILLAFINRS